MSPSSAPAINMWRCLQIMSIYWKVGKNFSEGNLINQAAVLFMCAKPWIRASGIRV